MLISIIIPIAKSQFLKQTIESVIAQTYKDWELILINDLLDVNVEMVLHEYKDIDKVRLYTPKKNLGANDPTKTWNYGLSFTTGQFGILLGDDDLLSPNYLEEMVNLVDLYPNRNIYRARLFVIDENNQSYEYGIGLPLHEYWDEIMYNRNFHERRQSTAEFLFNIDALKKIGGFISFPYAWASDDATWLILAKDFGIYSNNKAIAYFRRHAKALSGNMDTETVKSIETEFIKWSQQFITDNYQNSLIIKKDILLHSLHLRFQRIEERRQLSLSKKVKRNIKRSFFDVSKHLTSIFYKSSTH